MSHLQNLIHTLSLKDMEGALLTQAIQSHVLDNFPAPEVLKVNEALALAAYLHRNDTRANRANLPRDTYITHPLRNTLRLIRYGCDDIDILIASILHDTVEDHPFEIVTDVLSGLDAEDEDEARKFSYTYYEDAFSRKVAFLVEQVSNPLLPPDMSKAEKRKYYAEHLDIILDDPGTFLVKVSDIVDNAVGLYHNTGSPGMVTHLSTKYLAVLPLFFKRLDDEMFVKQLNLPVGGIDGIRRHLLMGQERLTSLASS